MFRCHDLFTISIRHNKLVCQNPGVFELSNLGLAWLRLGSYNHRKDQQEDRDHSYGSCPLCHLIRHNTRNNMVIELYLKNISKYLDFPVSEGSKIPPYSEDLYTI